MSQITARLPEETLRALDEAAKMLRRSRADIIRQAIELYIEDYLDLNAAVEALKDPTDKVLNWEEVRAALLDTDKE